jgi:hypothetical protein
VLATGVLAACGDTGSEQPARDAATAKIIDCLKQAGLKEARDGEEIEFLFGDLISGSVDHPITVGGPSFSGDVFQRGGSAPEEGDGGYQVYTLQSPSENGNETLERFREDGEGTVLYWESPTAGQVRSARACLP